jgi:type II secretory pathway pseudopilin PulG
MGTWGGYVSDRRLQEGFSVIEFMILLALLGIVGAIGVPNFIEMQYRAQRAEVPTNLEGIRAASIAFQVAHGHVLVEEIPRPDAFPDQRERSWKEGTRFDDLGWRPEGTVRGSYAIAPSTAEDFVVKGFCDVDGDGTLAQFRVGGSGEIRALTVQTVY